jgi:hypothetical protein
LSASITLVIGNKGPVPTAARERVMDRDQTRLQQNIARLRRDIRLQSQEMQTLIDSDIDCTNAARLLMRMQADLVLFVEKRERLKSKETA